MKNTITVANQQLHARPPDECFRDWPHLLRYLRQRDLLSTERVVWQNRLRVEPLADRVMLVAGSDGYQLNDWSFGQVCRMSKADPDFISRLTPQLAADALNQTREWFKDEEARMLFQDVNGGGFPMARALYSKSYARVPDLAVAELVHREASGFVPAGEVAGSHVGLPPVRPEATGLYASSRDMFLFLADEDNPVEWRPDNGGLRAAFYRFLIVANSETTSRKLCYTMGLMEGICGNHLIWGPKEVVLVERRHVGQPDRILEALRASIEALRDRRTINQDLRVLEAARTTAFADDKEKAVEILYPKYVTKAIAARAVESAIEDFHASLPLSVWSVVRGLTRVSQEIPYEDQRLEVDKAAGKLLAATKN
jgi:hypothetical protein